MGEVTVIAELLEHGLIQSQRSDHAVRRQVEYRADCTVTATGCALPMA